MKELLFILIGFGILSNSHAQEGNQVMASINVQDLYDVLSIEGVVSNQGKLLQSITYQLEVVKKSSHSGSTSRTVQSGHLDIDPGEQRTTSVVKTNAGNNQYIIAKLIIFQNGLQVTSVQKKIFNEAQIKTTQNKAL